MVYSEREFELMEEKYKIQLEKLQKSNELKEKENKILKEQNKQQAEVIHDLDKNNYRGECLSLREEIKELKKKAKRIRRAIRHYSNKCSKGQ